MDIVADIGGTNARFACYHADQTGKGTGKLSKIERFACADFPTMLEALENYCDTHQISPNRISLAVAGPADGPEVRLTNNNWSFNKQEIKTRFALSCLAVVNDFAAQALVPPYLEQQALKTIRTGTPCPDTPMLVLGAGTGLGCAAVLPVAGSWRPLETEGGNALLALCENDPVELTSFLCTKERPVSFETCLSGRGLEYLYQFLAPTKPPLSAKQIAKTAHADEQARAAILVFFNLLANFIANNILGIGARQGVYISGGIVPKLHTFLAESQFLARLSEHGSYSDYVGEVPIYLIKSAKAEQTGLLGAGLAMNNPYLSHRRI